MKEYGNLCNSYRVKYPELVFSDSEVSVAQVVVFSEAFGTDGCPFNKAAKDGCFVIGTKSVRNGFHFWLV